MGRPPLDVKPMIVRLPQGMAERIDAVAGENKRAEFIRDAVEKELSRREKTKEPDDRKAPTRTAKRKKPR